MIRHIVFFKLKESSAANKTAVKTKILSLKGKIEGVQHIEMGLNFSKETRAYDLALIVDFDTLSALQYYATHPQHLEALGAIKNLVEKTHVVDYEL
ncbi:Dabb family protein [Sulfurospirillum sp. 1612]|uniref:Dabb family protein n=1 Tax=Sulfurospirillum sp. 1612 TaxID=3094835 RepID=UPI002F9230F6